jgi:hypothetical protein
VINSWFLQKHDGNAVLWRDNEELEAVITVMDLDSDDNDDCIVVGINRPLSPIRLWKRITSWERTECRSA